MPETANRHGTAAYADGNAKRRASCDACNESKVRCSQAKPRCARCEKQGIICVYGLSRRSHKSAPRVGESQVSGGQTNSHSTFSPLPSPRSSSRADSMSNARPPFPDATMDSIHASLDPRTAFGDDIVSITDNSHLSSTNAAHGLDFSLQHQSTNSLDPTLDSLDPYNFLSQCISLQSPDASASSGQVTLMDSDTFEEWPLPERLSCDCTDKVTKQLLSIPLSWGDEIGSLDSQLSHLRRAISVLAECITCNCTSWDEMSIIAISLLAGRVVQGFETTLAKARPASSSGNSATTLDSSGSGTPNAMDPKLSWGVLQIEPNEEDELKQHLWLLQFRKLQKALKQLNISINRLRSAHGNANSAHVMACQCVYMWLIQKVELVKDRYLAQEGAVSTTGPEGQMQRLL